MSPTHPGEAATPAINTSKRLFDLVRFMRAELHEANLITSEEYAWLCEFTFKNDPPTGSPSPRRLEDYDELRTKLAVLEAQHKAALTCIAKKDEALRFCRDQRVNLIELSDDSEPVLGVDALQEIDGALALTISGVANKLAELRQFQEWCYVSIGSDNFATLKELLLQGADDHKELASLRTKLAEAEKDAERLQWLATAKPNVLCLCTWKGSTSAPMDNSDPDGHAWEINDVVYGPDLKAAIDAYRSTHPKP